MHRALLITAALVITTPAFADALFDQCYKLALDRVGPVSETHGGHFKRFVRECLRGEIRGGPIVAASASARSKTRNPDGQGQRAGDEPRDNNEGRIKCVTSTDGVKRCY